MFCIIAANHRKGQNTCSSKRTQSVQCCHCMYASGFNTACVLLVCRQYDITPNPSILTSTVSGKQRDNDRNRAGPLLPYSYRRCRDWSPCRFSEPLYPAFGSSFRRLRIQGERAELVFAENATHTLPEKDQRTGFAIHEYMLLLYLAMYNARLKLA